MTRTFSTLLKELRLRSGSTLRDFCNANNFDAGNYSRLERGLVPPPESPERLERYALALNLKRDSDEWFELFDLASVNRGRIPSDLLADEQLVHKLPVLFRTIRGKALTAEQLDRLIERVRRT